MNLHDVVHRALLGNRFPHTAQVWASVVRVSQGKSHIYEMPALNGIVACSVWAELWGGEIPTPICGAKPRNSQYLFSRMYADNAGARPWSNYCTECRNIENNREERIRGVGYWNQIYNQEGLDTFYAHAQTQRR